MAGGRAGEAARPFFARSTVRTTPSAPIGTSRKKTQRQFTRSITSPPSGGPIRSPPWNDIVM